MGEFKGRSKKKKNNNLPFCWYFPPCILAIFITRIYYASEIFQNLLLGSGMKETISLP